MNKMILSISCTIFFTGCTVHAPVVEVPSVSIEPPIRVIESRPVRVIESRPVYRYDNYQHRGKGRGKSKHKHRR